MAWIDACSTDDIPSEDVIRFDHGSRTFIIVRDHQDGYWCADGHCTHEDIHLCDGMVVECTIECPKHSSIFNVTNGEVETPPACNSLRTYQTKVEDGRVLIDI
jgi:3-phenylpropionate/trans-cinnamate dioxygenase ferredoxin component